MSIHDLAIVSSSAKIADGVEIGPFSIIGPDVKIGKNTKIHSNVVLDGHLEIGENNEFFQFCSIGAPPQDLTYKDEPTRVVIGDNNIFREYVSVHRGTKKENEVTIIGSGSLFMAYVHVGHDVVIGDKCTFANSVNFAGHVKIGSKCIIGGGTAISQFVNIGSGAYIGGATAIDRDIPIFCTAYGNRVKLKGINIIGMRRQGHDRKIINEVVDFYRTMESSKLSPRAFVDHEEFIQDYKDNSVIKEMCEHIRSSEIGIAPFA